MKKFVKKKDLHKLIKNWYEAYYAECEALHALSKTVLFKPYHNSGALSFMFDQLMFPASKKASDTKVKKVASEMADKINTYVSDYIQKHPDVDLQDLNKLEQEE